MEKLLLLNASSASHRGADSVLKLVQPVSDATTEIVQRLFECANSSPPVLSMPVS